LTKLPVKLHSGKKSFAQFAFRNIISDIFFEKEVKLESAVSFIKLRRLMC
jgi:hypothetical protein